MNPESKREKLAEYAQKISADTPARKRLLSLFDPETFVELNPFAGSGVVTGYGYVGETLVYAFSQDVEADDGAVTTSHAKKINSLYDLATKTGCPVIGIFDSKGAKLAQANDMLDAYGEILAKTSRVSGVVPQIAAVLGTCAGTSAMLACGADFLVMSEQAELFLTPPFVANAKGEKAEAGTASYASNAGIASIVAKDDEAAVEEVRRLVSMFPANNLAPAPLFETSENPEGLGLIQKAYGDIEHASAMDIITAIADSGSVVEIQKDFGKGIVAALATISGAAVGFIANDETQGDLGIDSCDKATRLIRTCDAFHLPVVTLVNTKGFEVTANPVLIRKSARLAHAYSETTTQKITVILGQAIGAAYMAFAANANADVTYAWPTAVISAMGLEASVEFMSHDRLKGSDDVARTRQELVEEYIDTTAGAFACAENGYVSSVIAPEATRVSIIQAIEMLAGKRETTLPKKHSIMPL